MDSSMEEYRFSKHFLQLSRLGIWPSQKNKKLHIPKQIFWLLVILLAIGLQMAELINVFGNIRKMAFNLCTSVIVVVTFVKVLIIHLHKIEKLQFIRLNLWRDSQKYNEKEDVAIMDTAFARVNSVSRLFYGGVCVILPVWTLAAYFSYLWGPRELAFSTYIVVPITSELIYVVALMIEVVIGIYVAKVVVEIDLAMFSIIVQLDAQYTIFIKNISKLNELYEEDYRVVHYLSELGFRHNKVEKSEVNRFLRKENTKELLKTFVMRQQELIEYTKTLEAIYSECMLIQLFGASLLLIMNGLEMILATQQLNVKLYYQSAYVALILIDILFICDNVTQLSTQCMNVGQAVYSINWYNMDSDLRKIITFMITRSQRPPKITAGKLFLMELGTYLSMLKNIYSWLMLFKQLETK